MTDDRNENDRKTKSQSESIDDNQQWWLRFVPNFKRWSDVNISRFLSIYKTQPVLWDPTHSFYKDQPTRMKAYSIIARRLNLYGIKERECVKLVKSLKDLYAEEKKRRTIAERSSQKYTSSPAWYCMLEETIEYVRQKLTNSVRKGSSITAEPPKPWEACCRQLYTEDIWTPQHFKTNVMDWFLTTQDEQLFCTCKQFSGTTFDDICSTETSSTYYQDSISNSSGEINQCAADKTSHSSKTCCFNTQNSSLPENNVDINNDEMQMCNNQKSKKGEKISFCKPYTVRNTQMYGGEKKRGRIKTGLKNAAHCPSASTEKQESNIRSFCSEAIYSEDQSVDRQRVFVEETCCRKTDYNDNIPKTNEECTTKKRQLNHEEKLVPCKNSEPYSTICKEEHDVLDGCGSKAVEKSLDGISRCPKNNISISESQETCGVKCENESLHCGYKRKLNDEQRQCHLQNTTGKSRLDEPALKSCGVRVFHPCGPKKLQKIRTMQATTHRNEGSVVSSKSEMVSSTESHDTCCSDSDTISATASGNSSHSSLLLSECRSLVEKEESDHRLDYHPDPTLCPKCAVDRVPIREVHKNIMHFEDPRMPELDKYCRYKDWDAIYNIRTQIPDEKPIIQIDDDLLFMMRYKDEPPRARRENHSPTEADINIFTDPKSSEARQVSLNDEYKREYDLNIQINQPRHYTCEVFEVPGHKLAQLIL